MLAPLIREMIAAELPVLEAHGLSMWGYSVLLALDRSAIRTQAALAEAIGADRRARLLAITTEGRRVKDATQAAIQRGEERWLGTLSAADRAVFLRVLQELSGQS